MKGHNELAELRSPAAAPAVPSAVTSAAFCFFRAGKAHIVEVLNALYHELATCEVLSTGGALGPSQRSGNALFISCWSRAPPAGPTALPQPLQRTPVHSVLYCSSRTQTLLSIREYQSRTCIVLLLHINVDLALFMRKPFLKNNPNSYFTNYLIIGEKKSCKDCSHFISCWLANTINVP